MAFYSDETVRLRELGERGKPEQGQRAAWRVCPFVEEGRERGEHTSAVKKHWKDKY